MGDCPICNLEIATENTSIYNESFGWIHKGCSDLRKIRPNIMAVALVNGNYIEGKITDVGEGSGIPLYEVGIRGVSGEDIFIHRDQIRSLYNVTRMRK